MLLICNCLLNYNQKSALRANFRSRELVGWAWCLTSSKACKSLVCLFLFNTHAKKGLSLLWSRNTVTCISTSQVSLKPSIPVLATRALFTLWCLPSKTPHFWTSCGSTFSLSSQSLPSPAFYLRIQEHFVQEDTQSYPLGIDFYCLIFQRKINDSNKSIISFSKCLLNSCIEPNTELDRY